jgi:hypothetical protein
VTEPRVRRRLEQPEPATPPNIRRLYWYGGAALGVLAGVLIALFVVPPIFDRYFGIADVELGHSHETEAVTLAGASAGLSADDPTRFEILLDVTGNSGWCPTPADFRLELRGNVSIGAPRLDPAADDCAATGAPIDTPTLAVSFPANGRTADQLHILHITDPKVRFWLQPGEPGE